MEQGSCLNDEVEILSNQRLNLSVPLKILIQIKKGAEIWLDKLDLSFQKDLSMPVPFFCNAFERNMVYLPCGVKGHFI